MKLGTEEEVSEEEIARQLEKEGEIEMTVGGSGNRVPVGPLIEILEDGVDHPDFDVYLEQAELVFVTEDDS